MKTIGKKTFDYTTTMLKRDLAEQTAKHGDLRETYDQALESWSKLSEAQRELIAFNCSYDKSIADFISIVKAVSILGIDAIAEDQASASDELANKFLEEAVKDHSSEHFDPDIRWLLENGFKQDIEECHVDRDLLCYTKMISFKDNMYKMKITAMRNTRKEGYWSATVNGSETLAGALPLASAAPHAEADKSAAAAGETPAQAITIALSMFFRENGIKAYSL